MMRYMTEFLNIHKQYAESELLAKSFRVNSTVASSCYLIWKIVQCNSLKCQLAAVISLSMSVPTVSPVPMHLKNPDDSLKNPFSLFFCLLLSIAFSNNAHAAKPIPSDLSFTGEFGLDLYISGPLSTTQSGTFFARQDLTDSPGAYTDDSLVNGTNPTNATLVMHGEGVIGGGDGFGGTASATIEDDNCCGPQSGSEVFGDTDLGDQGQTEPLRIINSSTHRAYKVYFSVSYNHSVNAMGNDAENESDLEIMLNGVEIFEAEIISDLYNGNSVNKVPLQSSGGLVSDNGVFHFSTVVNPGETDTVELDYTMDGKNYANNSGIQSSASYFLSVDDIQLLPPQAVPSMTIWGLGALAGLLGFIGFRKRIPRAKHLC